MKIQDLSFLVRAGLSLCLGVILCSPSPAQCVNNMATRSYDTVLTGIGYGNYTLQFPKWNPDSGLLASVKINARVSVHYAFTLKNVDRVASTYSLWVGREDYISSAAMSNAYDSITERKIGVFPLDPGSGLSQGPFTFLDNYINTDSITANTAGFLGIGKVNLAYSPVTYTTLHTNNNSSYSYSSAAQDTVHFSLTYLYCRSGGVLASQLTRFSAVLLNPATVQLDWAVVNEVAGRHYQVQRSRDGQHFTPIASLRAVSTGEAADYAYADSLTPGAGGRWYYRLQFDNLAGIAYSEVRQIEVTGGNTDAPGLSIYPNPAIDFVDLVFAPAAGSGAGWQIELWAADGKRIFTNQYPLTNTIHVSFPHKQAAGVYFLHSRDLQGTRQFINRILIR